MILESAARNFLMKIQIIQEQSPARISEGPSGEVVLSYIPEQVCSVFSANGRELARVWGTRNAGEAEAELAWRREMGATEEELVALHAYLRAKL